MPLRKDYFLSNIISIVNFSKERDTLLIYVLSWESMLGKYFLQDENYEYV